MCIPYDFLRKPILTSANSTKFLGVTLLNYYYPNGVTSPSRSKDCLVLNQKMYAAIFFWLYIPSYSIISGQTIPNIFSPYNMGVYIYTSCNKVWKKKTQFRIQSNS